MKKSPTLLGAVGICPYLFPLFWVGVFYHGERFGFFTRVLIREDVPCVRPRIYTPRKTGEGQQELAQQREGEQNLQNSCIFESNCIYFM